jgi:hypothetical protein
MFACAEQLNFQYAEHACNSRSSGPLDHQQQALSRLLASQKGRVANKRSLLAFGTVASFKKKLGIPTTQTHKAASSWSTFDYHYLRLRIKGSSDSEPAAIWVNAMCS